MGNDLSKKKKKILESGIGENWSLGSKAQTEEIGLKYACRYFIHNNEQQGRENVYRFR